MYGAGVPRAEQVCYALKEAKAEIALRLQR